MPLLYLVRHGQALGSVEANMDARDPGLDETGILQAKRFAEEFGAAHAPLPVISSPMRRAQETSAPLADAWGRSVSIDLGVREIVSPSDDPAERKDWVHKFMLSRWSEAGAEQQCWRANLVRALLDIPQDTVIFTHFMVINAAVSEAEADDRTVSFSPQNCSVTVIETHMDQLRVIERGEEMTEW